MSQIKKLIILLIFLIPSICFSYYVDRDYKKFNAFNQKYLTMESEHFRLHHPKELKETAEEIANILERLHGIYKDKYKLTLPDKTDVLVSDDDYSGGWAIPFEDIMHIWANDFDWNLRGTTNWLENVVAHEYAHIISIWASYKMPQKIPYIQYGTFTHPNEKTQFNMLHVFPSEILPPWFTEGIAQYESTKMKGDNWDSHRDMILRTLTLSGNLLSWDHMQVFSADRTYEYELTYNHGFSLVQYIVEKYGEEYLVSILREASKMPRLNFDRAIKAALGISGRDLYDEWKSSLEVKYKKQVKDLGTQIYGRKWTRSGWNFHKPRFCPKDSLVYFHANGKDAFSGKTKFQYADLYDTTHKDDSVIFAKPLLKHVSSNFDIHDSSYKILFTSGKERSSTLPSNKGGVRTKDLFIDQLPKPGEKKKGIFAKKLEQQVTKQKSIFHGSFSPTGDSIAISKHIRNRFVLMMTDSSGKKEVQLYPPKDKPELAIHTIYGLDWSPNGKYIAVDYIDKDNRKIGLYEVGSGNFFDLCDTKNDERHPRFTNDGKSILFSSNRTGIFNIYKYSFEKEELTRLTNVSGGAFEPEFSRSMEKMAYVGFDKSFYSLYIIDTIKVIETSSITKDNALKARKGNEIKKLTTENMRSKKYSKMPRDLLVVPMLYSEQIFTDEDDFTEGKSSFKFGAMFQLLDPLYWAGKGNSILAYFLYNPKELPFVRGDVINRKADVDLGIMGYTDALPIDLSISHLRRSLSGRDYFNYDGYGTDSSIVMDYNLNPSFTQIWAHHNTGAWDINLNLDYMKYNVWVRTGLTSDKSFFKYVPTKGVNGGIEFNLVDLARSSRSNIAPKPTQVRLKYNFNSQYMQNEINSFSFDGGIVKENYVAPYRYHSVEADLLFSSSLPIPGIKNVRWLNKHTIVGDVHATALKLTNKSKKALQKDVDKGFLPSTNLPSYMQPAAILPGYTYYYKDTSVTIYNKGKPDADTVKVYTDTALISGDGLISANLTYRFPLFPGSIDKKIGFLYLEYLYGCINFGGATSVSSFNDIKELKRKDILLYRGLELRLSTIAFSTYPLMISARYDHGIDLPEPIGGPRFTLTFDFELDRFSFLSKNRIEDKRQDAFPKRRRK